MQVSSIFASTMDTVGGGDDIRKEVLLATSTASRITHAPAEVDLGNMQIRTQAFSSAYLPVAIRLEGNFPSVFANRMVPEGLEEHHLDRLEDSRYPNQE